MVCPFKVFDLLMDGSELIEKVTQNTNLFRSRMTAAGFHIIVSNCKKNSKYCISSPISPVIFSVFDTEICEIFHQKRGSAYSRGFGI